MNTMVYSRISSDLLITVIIVLVSVIKEAISIKCVQCNSLMSPDGCLQGNIPPSDCVHDHAGAKYCIKYVGKWNVGMIVFRDCAQHYRAPQCELKVIEKKRMKLCYETCDIDGCNAYNNGETASLYMESNNSIVTQPFVMMLILSAVCAFSLS